MLRFLRKIRRCLLEEGRLKTYFFYGIGEILLVVIGILLALQVNNWNLNRTNKNLEKQYYQNIMTQLGEDLSNLKGNMEYNQFYLDQFQYARNIILSEDFSSIDTLGEIALSLTKYADFRRKSNVYQTLIYSGEIKLINNQQVLEGLESLEEIYTYINRLEESHFEAILTLVVPDIKQAIRMVPLSVKKPQQLYSYPFQNNFDLLIGLMTEKKEVYEQAENKIIATIALIRQQLNPSTTH